jgi:hypothetical protein
MDIEKAARLTRVVEQSAPCPVRRALNPGTMPEIIVFNIIIYFTKAGGIEIRPLSEHQKLSYLRNI